jgi:hypothetical protein
MPTPDAHMTDGSPAPGALILDPHNVKVRDRRAITESGRKPLTHRQRKTCLARIRSTAQLDLRNNSYGALLIEYGE